MPDDEPSRIPGLSFLSRSLRLTEVLSARLCHDLSGSVGTITNALELARESRDTLPEALALAQESSGELGRRLRLLRATWAGGGGPMAPAELLRLAEGLRSARRLKIDVSAVRADLAFEASAARLMLGVLMLAEESLPRGGRLALAGHPSREIVVLIEGPQALWPTGLAGWLADEEAAWRAIEQPMPRVGPLVVLMAREQGARLSFLLSAGTSGDPPGLLVRFGP